jgi:tetratricopeptide (TPR) repeat protein
MKRLTLLVVLTAALTYSTYGQNAAKGLKAIDAKDYTTAWKELEGAHQADANDIAANFGLSRLFGIGEAGKKSKEKALEHLQAAEAAWARLDEKGREKLVKSGVTTAELDERRTKIESTFLEAAKAENTLEAYNAFLEAFPNAKALTTATNYRNALAFEMAQEQGTVEALDKFLAAYPKAEQAAEAATIRNQMATAEALKANTEEALKNFLKKYPDALQAPQIQQRLNAVAFENAKAANTIEAFENYIILCPESVFITQAKERLEWLKSQGEK